LACKVVIASAGVVAGNHDFEGVRYGSPAGRLLENVQSKASGAADRGVFAAPWPEIKEPPEDKYEGNTNDMAYV
jgi:hypothetical protein